AVYNGTGTSVTVTGLSHSTTYHVEVFEYNIGSAELTQNYNVSSTLVGNQATDGPDAIEDFESGSKGGYTAAGVTLSTGNWYFSDALIGALANDKKNGSSSARIQNSGYIEMQFDVIGGVSSVSYYYASYGSDASATVEAFYSVDGGSSWTSLGTNATTVTLQKATVAVNIITPIRFKIGKTGGNRVNIDDVSLNYTTTGAGYRQITGAAGWRMLSSPIDGFTVEDISDNTAIQGV